LDLPPLQDPEDPMDDIPLDLTPYFLQWKQQTRRADGSRVSHRDIPAEWNLTPEEREAMVNAAITTSYTSPPPRSGLPPPSLVPSLKSGVDLPPHMP